MQISYMHDRTPAGGTSCAAPVLADLQRGGVVVCVCVCVWSIVGFRARQCSGKHLLVGGWWGMLVGGTLAMDEC